MMLNPAGIKVHLAPGYTDLRKGIDGLGVLVERVLEQDPFSDTTLPRAGAHFEDAHRRLLVDAGIDLFDPGVEPATAQFKEIPGEVPIDRSSLRCPPRWRFPERWCLS